MRTVKYVIALALCILALPFSAMALDIDTLRAQGSVGEGNNGYVSAIGSQSAEVAAFVKEVNAKRNARYKEVAGNTGQSLAVVEKLAAQNLVNRLSAGQYFQDAAGKWVRK